MAKKVFKNAYVALDGVDYSDHVASVTLNYDADTQEATAMGDDTHGFLPGLKNWTAEIEFYNDYADNSIDEVAFAAIGAANGTTIAIRPENTTISATNPEYQGTGVVTSHQPVTGAVGDIAKTKLSIVPFAGSDLVRDITA